jgi:hypothetical protein
MVALSRAIEQTVFVLNCIFSESNELALEAIKLGAFHLCVRFLVDRERREVEEDPVCGTYMSVWRGEKGMCKTVRSVELERERVRENPEMPKNVENPPNRRVRVPRG